ncbi:VWA domain-containing protein [Paenibacillus sp. CF384]|uniref:VWA domain-containing protein n=1 Tax=Paenibacillus sp. CF384 TaxID=1884382 RepID=UPI0008989A95|nr:VWA domain-containing protein [Paenibacillus sp. CF384]SDW42759.1 Mg-chelatase subunit ChlD [Paenibacillus sp. CF384]
MQQRKRINREHAPGKENEKGQGKMKTSLLLLAALTFLLAGCSSADNQNDSAANKASSSNSSNTEARNNSSASNRGEATTNSSSNDRADSSVSEEPAHDTDDSPIDKDETTPPGSQYDDSQAGQLTAGESDDLTSWKEWVRLLNSGEGRELQSYWSVFPQNRLEVVVTGGGKPVSDAEVSLVDDDGDTVWESRTNIDGEASAYAGLFDEQQNQERYGVIIRSGNQEKQYENVQIPRGSALRVDLNEQVKPSLGVDLMLVVDTTGSMQDELDFLKSELKDVVARVLKNNGQQLDIQVSTNFYRDRSDKYLVKDYPFTKDIDTAVKQISQQEAAGGGDFPEAVDEALENAIDDHKWSGDARARLLFLVLDAPPHHERKVTKRIHELMESAAAEGIRIIPIASSGVDVQTEYLMRFMATATGGTYLFLTDHSGIGNDHMEPAVGEYEVKRLNDLLVEVISRYTSE